MAHFLELTELETKKEILVNIEHVLTIAPHLETNAKIEFGNEVLFVYESYWKITADIMVNKVPIIKLN